MNDYKDYIIPLNCFKSQFFGFQNNNDEIFKYVFLDKIKKCVCFKDHKSLKKDYPRCRVNLLNQDYDHQGIGEILEDLVNIGLEKYSKITQEENVIKLTQ